MEKLHSRFAHLSYKMLCIIIFTYLIYMIGRFTTAITFFFKKKKHALPARVTKEGLGVGQPKLLLPVQLYRF